MILTWLDKLNSVASRVGEPDLLDPAVNTEQQTPYFEGDVTERFLYRSSLFLLRSVPVTELEAIGSPAIALLSGASAGATPITTVPVPLNTTRVISAMIDAGPGPRPATYLDPKAFLQMLTCTPTELLAYTFIDGFVAMPVGGATTFTITLLVEPTLADFQSDAPILPPGYDEPAIDRTKTFLMLTDYLPAGRL